MFKDVLQTIVALEEEYKNDSQRFWLFRKHKYPQEMLNALAPITKQASFLLEEIDKTHGIKIDENKFYDDIIERYNLSAKSFNNMLLIMSY